MERLIITYWVGGEEGFDCTICCEYESAEKLRNDLETAAMAYLLEESGAPSIFTVSGTDLNLYDFCHDSYGKKYDDVYIPNIRTLDQWFNEEIEGATRHAKN